mmetsp:Transcript_13991/g.41009  ORF Transcript_13991/g.41009 Transcript_13991/m.41009 type:complete len:431 (-) Transcript_13991:362-1654(-)
MAGGSRPMRPSYVFVNAVLHVLPHTGLALVAVACQLHALPPTGKGWLWFWPPVVSWPALQRAGCSVFSHAVAAFPHPQPMLFYPEPWQGLGVFAGGWRAGVVIAITTAACAVWLQTALRLKPFQTQGSKALVALAVLWLASISHFLPGAIIPSPHAEPSLGGDRYAYLPSLFLALVPATAYLAGRSCWFPGHTRIGGGPLRALMLVVAVAAPVRMVARSASAARAWKSSESLMETALLQFQPLAEEFLAHRDQTRWQAVVLAKGRGAHAEACAIRVAEGECEEGFYHTSGSASIQVECPRACTPQGNHVAFARAVSSWLAKVSIDRERRGDLRGAAEASELSLRVHSGSAMVFRQAGGVKFKLRQWRQAAALMRRAIHIAPRDPQALRAYGMARESIVNLAAEERRELSSEEQHEVTQLLHSAQRFRAKK